MDMSVIMSQGTMILGVLVALTNIIVEVVKMNFTLDAKQINRVATIVSVVLTEIAGIGYTMVYDVPFEWYMIIVFAIAGFIVALGSMIGYDKILSYFTKGE